LLTAIDHSCGVTRGWERAGRPTAVST